MHYNPRVLGGPKSKAGQIWKAMREARAVGLYYGGLAGRYTRQGRLASNKPLAPGAGIAAGVAFCVVTGVIVALLIKLLRWSWWP